MKKKDILERKLLNKTGRAIADFNMIENGDRIIVALSGGKDSWTLLHLLEILRNRAPIKFSILALNINAGFEEKNSEIITSYLRLKGYEYHVEKSNIYRLLELKSKNKEKYCVLCSRLRRGILYSFARDKGYNKIALGHHGDDLIETLLLNQFFEGKIKSMAPKLFADDGINQVIRPMSYVEEKLISDYVKNMDFPVVSCGCPVSGSVKTKRHEMKELLNLLEKKYPGIRGNILGAMKRISLDHLLDPDYINNSQQPGK